MEGREAEGTAAHQTSSNGFNAVNGEYGRVLRAACIRVQSDLHKFTTLESTVPLSECHPLVNTPTNKLLV